MLTVSKSNLRARISGSVLISFLCFSLLTLSALAQGKFPLRVTVEKEEKRERNITHPGRVERRGNTHTHYAERAESIQQVGFTIRVLNMGLVDLTGLSVHAVVFGRGVDTRLVEAEPAQTFPVSPKATQSVSVKSERVKFVVEELTYPQGIAAKEDERTGKKYYGIAVVVTKDGQRVATYFDPKDLEKNVEKMKFEQNSDSQKASRAK